MYARDDRPAREPEDPRRAAMARRSLSRWALRLALREWKQRILIILLIGLFPLIYTLTVSVQNINMLDEDTSFHGAIHYFALLKDMPAARVPGAVAAAVERTGLETKARAKLRTLSGGMLRRVGIAQAIVNDPELVLFDEPTAGLSKPERTLIGGILADLSRRDGLCILLIEHDLDFVRDISTRIIVLHQGKVLLDGSVKQVVESELVRSIYAGEILEPASQASS